MDYIARRLRDGCAIPLGYALAALWAAPASATDLHLLTPDSLEFSGDIRLVAVDGEKSWLDGGYGKLRSGSNGDLKVQPQMGNENLIWKPQFTWSLSAIVVGSLEGGERTDAGISQAYLSFRSMRSTSGTSFAARAGLMWPPVSLENEGADWHVADSITPSVINSWIGEEVRPVAAEGTLSADLGSNKVRATAAVFAANDTSGTLLTFRGWALHDRTTLAFNSWPLPRIEGPLGEMQARFTHPLIDLHKGFAHRPGYYVKLAWQPPIPVRLELFHYDNRADPEESNDQMEWGWATKFNDLGLLANLGGGAELKAQALQGRTRMGFEIDGKRWADNRFRSAFMLATVPAGVFGLAARAEVFDTRNQGSLIDDDYDETGWSAMIAAKRELKHFTIFVELLHVSSRREDRDDVGLNPRQDQTQLQGELRIHW